MNLPTNAQRISMILEHPLLGLIKNCETLCEAQCCGLDAFDFSPVHIASYLLRYTGKIEQSQISAIQSQLRNLKVESERLADGHTLAIEEMNQIFTGTELSRLVDEILDSLELVPKLVSFAEKYSNNRPEMAPYRGEET